MGVTGRFVELNTNMNYVIQLLLENQNLLKLLYYNDNNPLSQPDIINPKSLLFNHIYPLPKIADVAENQKSIISVMFSNAHLNREGNIKLKDYKIIFYIMSHIDLWKVSGGIRPLLISHELDNIFNEKSVKQFVGRILFGDWIYKEFNNKYYGYYLTYDISNFN